MHQDKAHQVTVESRNEADHKQRGSHTCPMHPEVQQQDSGHCPKCGMSLEPLTPPTATGSPKFTCPMHPQILRDEPGFCPICGMALEPVEPQMVEATSKLGGGELA